MVQLTQISSTAEPTEIGSYFIANYPPFSAWTSDELHHVADALDRPTRHAAPLGLYLHIPFCRKRCTFCYFRVYTDKNADEVDAYTDTLAREISLYASRSAFAGRQFEFVYFGGGTPSFLSNDQLKRLIDRISRHWTWSAAREVTFECEPGTLKQSKLETIRSIGVTRLSLGVEHFDDDVLAANGRAHKSPEVFRAYEWARTVGFPQINIDLIAGMVGDTEDKWKSTVDKTLALDPDSVTLYQMELPHNTVISRLAKETHAPPPVADWNTKRAWIDHAFRVFESAGYKVSSAYTLVKPSPRAGFIYRDSLWHGADLVGTGVASFSHVAGVHFQNVDQWTDYMQRVAKGELPLSRAMKLSLRQRLIRELILQLKTGSLDARYFREKYDSDIFQDFADPIRDLVKVGFAHADSDTLRLTRPGLLRADALLPRFFEPAYRNVRYT